MQMDTLQRLRGLASALHGRASELSEGAVGDSFDYRVAQALDLVDHGEPEVALENLAQNVFEFDVPLSQAEYQAFDEAGRAMNLDPGAWNFLADLVR
jgi:hypothetical protein